MNAETKVNGKFNRKLLAATLIVIVVAAGALVVWQVNGQQRLSFQETVSLPPLELTVIGAGGQRSVLDSAKLAALKSYTGTGGYNDEANSMLYTGNFTGVPVTTLLNLVGGISSGDNVTFTGSDGYQITFTYQQIQGQNINTFNPDTFAAQTPTKPLTVIVAYYCNCTAISGGKGPLTVAIVGPEGLLTNGYWWAYLLIKIQVIPP